VPFSAIKYELTQADWSIYGTMAWWRTGTCLTVVTILIILNSESNPLFHDDIPTEVNRRLFELIKLKNILPSSSSLVGDDEVERYTKPPVAPRASSGWFGGIKPHANPFQLSLSSHANDESSSATQPKEDILEVRTGPLPELPLAAQIEVYEKLHTPKTKKLSTAPASAESATTMPHPPHMEELNPMDTAVAESETTTVGVVQQAATHNHMNEKVVKRKKRSPSYQNCSKIACSNTQFKMTQSSSSSEDLQSVGSSSSHIYSEFGDGVVNDKAYFHLIDVCGSKSDFPLDGHCPVGDRS
jgi:hypothetical protein